MTLTATALTAISSAPALTPDVAHLAWPALTVRVAWTLLTSGIRVRPGLLRDARDHVLMHLPAEVGLCEAEDRAADLVVRFVARARRREPQDHWPQDAAMPLSPRWRRAIDHACTPLIGAVFRQHYGDGRRLESLERLLEVDRTALEAARGSLREIVRRLGATDGLPFDQWPGARVDRVIGRLAAWSPGPCPPILEIADGHHREHLHGCVRCDRAYRLVQNEIISRGDLVPPAMGARPNGLVRVLALHFHPDARVHRDLVARESAVPCFPVGDDLLLIDFSDPDAVRRLITVACEVGRPTREHLRGATLAGAGRWTPHGLIGPLAERAIADVKLASWGEVQGVSELPTPLPEPPSSRGWWTAVAAIAAVGVGLFMHAVQVPRAPARWPLETDFVVGRDGTWAKFRVDERAVVSAVRVADGQLDPLRIGVSAADKSEWATGDGTYRLHAVGDGLAVVSSTVPIATLASLVEDARKDADPLGGLVSRVRAADPYADVAVWTR